MSPQPRNTMVGLAALVFICMFNLTFIVPSVKELIIDRFDASSTDASLFVSIEMIAYLIFGMVWGGVSDRRGQRKILIVLGFLASSGLYFSMSIAPNLLTLLVLRFLQGAGSVAAWSLLMTIAMDSADPTRYGASMGIIGTGLALGLGFGAPIGGALGDVDATYPLYAASLLFLAAALASVLTVHDTPITHRPESIRKAVSVALREPRALSLYSFSLVERFSAGFMVLVLPLYLADEFGSSAGERGLYLSAFLLAFAVLQYPFGKLADKKDRRMMLIAGGSAYALGLAGIGLVDKEIIALVMIMLGSLAAMLLPASLGLLCDLAPLNERGSFMGGFNAIGSLGFAIGPLFGALTYESFGHSTSFVAGGVVIAVIVLTSVPFLPIGRRGTCATAAVESTRKPL